MGKKESNPPAPIESVINFISGQRYLITTDNWFYAPDGKQYRAVWGKVQIFPDTILGVKTNAKSSNWYAVVGENGNEIIIAGCQIHYAVRSEIRPNDDAHRHWEHNEKKDGINRYDIPCMIWFTEE
jgi:hypothetical protein